MKDAIEVFNRWAEIDKDRGMEEGHANAVNEMLDYALKERHEINNDFTFLDLGCGNGWVVRKVLENPLCINTSGIDGAPQMILFALKIGSKWVPNRIIDAGGVRKPPERHLGRYHNALRRI